MLRQMITFVLDCFKEAFRGSRLYLLWMAGLSVLVLAGLIAFVLQFQQGLILTGMSDQISWGIYIANFAFLVGLAAAAVMLVIPAYIFQHESARSVVVLAEAMAVAACVMAMMFVVADLGHPDRFWHLIPFIGRLSWPGSMLSWDVIVLNGYLFLNVSIPAYFLFTKYRGQTPNPKIYFPGVLIAIFWAISIHSVTAFLFSSNPARPFWNTALLGPRFIATAFTAGPAFMILALKMIHRHTRFEVHKDVIDYLALVTTVALQISLFMVGAELFTEFYAPTSHSASARFLFFGIGEYRSLVPWIWTALSLEVMAVIILMIHDFRSHSPLLNVACVFSVIGVWIEKGMGHVIPGFVPTPLGEVFEYKVTLTEVLISLGIWAFGFMLYTGLAKAAIEIELGELKMKSSVKA